VGARPPHVGVVCEEETFKVLRIIVQGDGEDGMRLFDGTHNPQPGEVMAVIPKSEVNDMDLRDMAVTAVYHQFGRNPLV